MKTLVVHDATDLPTLARRIGGSATVEQLRQLNPHLSPETVPAGTVLLVAMEHVVEGAQSPGVAHGQALAAEMKEALGAALSASAQGLQLRAKERKQVVDALRSPAMQRVLKADPDLGRRAARVAEEHRKELAQDRASEKALRQLQSSALAEIDKLLRGMN